MVVQKWLEGRNESGKGNLILKVIFCRDIEDKPGWVQLHGLVPSIAPYCSDVLFSSDLGGDNVYNGTVKYPHLFLRAIEYSVRWIKWLLANSKPNYLGLTYFRMRKAVTYG
jgi:hypothetical protein